jgi:hypothetical protein
MGAAGLTKARRRPELQDFTGVNILGRFTEDTSFLIVIKLTFNIKREICVNQDFFIKNENISRKGAKTKAAKKNVLGLFAISWKLTAESSPG